MLAADSAAPRAAWLRGAIALYLTIRVSALGFTLVLPLVGAASVGATMVPSGGLSHMAGLMLVAVSFHVFAYVMNDVVDLWLDRSEPLRADSPLVQGAVGRSGMIALAWAQLPIAFGLAWALGAHPAALAMLGLAFAAMALYDIYGKRCRWPLLTDAVQAIGWCACVAVGAWWDGPVQVSLTGWVAAYVFFCVMLVQGVHGGLRDLANDHRGGARTSAIWLGARPGAGTGILLSGSMVGYAVLLQVALWVTALMALAEVDASVHVTGAAATRAWVIALLVVATGALGLAYQRRQERRRLMAAGAWNIVATLFGLPVLVWPALGASEAALMLGALALPIAAMLVYNGSHWRLAPQPPATVRVTVKEGASR